MSRGFTVSPGGMLRGDISVPGDKSISHRAVILGALATGRTTVRGFLPGEDTLGTAAIFRQLGVPIDRVDTTTLQIAGVGLRGLKPSTTDLDCGNAGTAMRLLAGVLAAQPFASVLTGDASLRSRPMRRVLAPLRMMGAKIDANADGTAPLRMAPCPGLHGIRYQAAQASAQVKSAVLLAGLYAEGDTTVIEDEPTRDYTETMLRTFGADIDFAVGRARVRPAHALQAMDIDVPGDFSSAAFFLVGAAIAPGSDLIVRGVGVNPRRTGLLDCLRDMGAQIDVVAESTIAGESVADLRVRGGALRGIEVPLSRVSDMIDEFPAFLIAAAVADGTTRVRGAHELRVKESDRLAMMASGLRTLGVDLSEYPDGIDIVGRSELEPSTAIDSGTDHRIAMAFAMAGLRANAPIHITRVDNVATSFPGFDALASGVGLALTVSQAVAA